MDMVQDLPKRRRPSSKREQDCRLAGRVNGIRADAGCIESQRPRLTIGAQPHSRAKSVVISYAPAIMRRI